MEYIAVSWTVSTWQYIFGMFCRARGTLMCIIIIIIWLFVSLKMYYLIDGSRTTFVDDAVIYSSAKKSLFLSLIRKINWLYRYKIFLYQCNIYGESLFKMLRCTYIDKKIIMQLKGTGKDKYRIGIGFRVESPLLRFHFRNARKHQVALITSWHSQID